MRSNIPARGKGLRIKSERGPEVWQEKKWRIAPPFCNGLAKAAKNAAAPRKSSKGGKKKNKLLKVKFDGVPKKLERL